MTKPHELIPPRRGTLASVTNNSSVALKPREGKNYAASSHIFWKRDAFAVDLGVTSDFCCFLLFTRGISWIPHVTACAADLV